MYKLRENTNQTFYFIFILKHNFDSFKRKQMNKKQQQHNIKSEKRKQIYIRKLYFYNQI